jgi:DNA-binding transcriptional ArsR family regulator
MSATQLAELARLLADRTRAEVCVTLLDGRAWTAGELAAATGVAASTMSEHLSRLIIGGVLSEIRQGRHRYVALAGPDVAGALEQLLALTEPRPQARTLRAVSATEALARGRTCYDHLAGRLGVAVTEAMSSRGLLGDNLAVTAQGREWLAAELGFEPGASRRTLSRACLDWTERRSHLAGAAGAHVCVTFLARGWVARVGTGRAARVTRSGERALGELLGLDVTALA